MGLETVSQVLVIDSPEGKADGTPGGVVADVSRSALTTDGSARGVPLGRILPGIDTGDGQMADGGVHFFDMFEALHSISGVAGRDLR